jgi:hypothetical protein
MLEKTLAAFQADRVPDDLRVELIVADNGSLDHTAAVTASANHPPIRDSAYA